MPCVFKPRAAVRHTETVQEVLLFVTPFFFRRATPFLPKSQWSGNGYVTFKWGPLEDICLSHVHTALFMYGRIPV